MTAQTARARNAAAPWYTTTGVTLLAIGGTARVRLLGVVLIASQVDPILGQPLEAFGVEPAWSPLLDILAYWNLLVERSRGRTPGHFSGLGGPQLARTYTTGNPSRSRFL